VGPVTGAETRWDPEQYARFAAERAQPFRDLVARMEGAEVRFAADLGCGTGELTRTLLARWPGARIWGVDHSAEMLARAAARPADPNLSFVRADLRAWQPPHPLDRVVSNAVLQWLPDHAAVLARLASWLSPGGWLGVQVPNNYAEPAYLALAELAGSSRWAGRLAGAHHPGVESPDWYLERLVELGLDADVWETIYTHRLPGPDAVVEWMEGTVLRPVLARLAPDEAAAFRAELSARVANAHPVGPCGVLFHFRRIFCVARRRGDW
jgi:trans-aconitate 2-methyltransferase